jgi:hypothetical protein
MPATRRSWRRKEVAVVLTASALLLGTGSLLAWSAIAAKTGTSAALTAAASASTAVTLNGSVPGLPAASATVTVEAQLSQDPNAQGVPQELQDVPVATATITSPQFTIAVPASATLTQAEQDSKGIVQFEIMLASGGEATSIGFSAPLTAPAAVLNTAQQAAESSRTDQLPVFPAFAAAPHAQAAASTAAQALAVHPDGADRDPPSSCGWSPYGKQFDKLTRIGEVHVANAPGVTDDYEYTNENDQTISFLISSDPAADFVDGGTLVLTNSLSANGGRTFGRGVTTYVYTTEFYQEYKGVGVGGGCARSFKMRMKASSTVSMCGCE